MKYSKNLGYETDLFLTSFEGSIYFKKNYLVAVTPSNPGFFYGNYILLKNDPTKESFSKWREVFKDEFKDYPEVLHETLCWESPDLTSKDYSFFEKAGFELEKSFVLKANQVKVPKNFNSKLTIRPIESAGDWEKVVKNQTIYSEHNFNKEHYRKFIENKFFSYKKMINKGRGTWYGCFDQDDNLLGDLGLFSTGEVARFQMVGTHPLHRRMGVCRSLVYHVSKKALEQNNTLVMVADPKDVAIKIYQDLGFEFSQVQMSAFKANKESVGS